MIWKGQDINNRVSRTEKKFTRSFSCVYLKNAIVSLQEHVEIKYLYRLYLIHPFREIISFNLRRKIVSFSFYLQRERRISSTCFKKKI